MRRLSFLLATLLALGFICGCSGGGGGGPVQLENVCEEMKDAMCDYIKKCDLEWYLQFATRETCDEMFDCDDMALDEMAKAVAAGRMEYDAALAGTCLQKIRNAECSVLDDVFDGLDEECEDVFKGLVLQDGDCYQENECSEGLYCDESVQQCPGKCQPFKDIGQTCNGGDCDPDQADCDYQQGVCAALAGVGQVCENVDCEEGLVCDYNSNPEVCIDPAGAGGSCTSTRGCETGLQCVGGTCEAPAGAGKDCDVGEDFENIMFACVANYYCDADIVTQQRTGKCQPKKGAGSDCILFYECKSGLLCIGMTFDEQTEQVVPGSCGQPLGAGGSCNPDFEFPECDWDLYCDESTSRCTAYPGIGDPCVYGEDPECFTDDLYCDSLDYGVPGLCAQKKPDNSSCTSWEECQSDNCINGTCQADEECIAP